MIGSELKRNNTMIEQELKNLEKAYQYASYIKQYLGDTIERHKMDLEIDSIERIQQIVKTDMEFITNSLNIN